MDCRRLKLLILFLFASTNIVCLHGNPITGVDYNLHCVNNYQFTINCSLNIPPSETSSDSNSSYWLTFEEIEELKEKFSCMLTNNNGDYFCSAISDPMPDEDYPDTLTDSDHFKISLCHKQNGSESCVQLEDNYEPEKNIKLDAPCCLTVSNNSSHYHFTWRSTYEQYEQYSGLNNHIQYQLQFYMRGDKTDATSHEINTVSMYYSVDEHLLVPGMEYAARVRSSPNQGFFMGQWSDWSPEVYWETTYYERYPVPSSTPVSGLGHVLIPFCVLVPLMILFCYAPVKKCKQSAFIPTPEPYFHTLYSDCQGDFKSWVITQDNISDMMKVEETLTIDTLTKCAVMEEEEEAAAACWPQCHHQFTDGSTYSNMTVPGCDVSLLGVPYAVSTMAPQSSPEGSQSGGPDEGDSGCWLERDPPWYCNEYCTLSAFQQSSPVTSEHHGSPTKSSPGGVIRVEATNEA